MYSRIAKEAYPQKCRPTKYQPAADTSRFPFQTRERSVTDLKLVRGVIQTEVGFSISTDLVYESRFNEVSAGRRYEGVPFQYKVDIPYPPPPPSPSNPYSSALQIPQKS